MFNYINQLSCTIPNYGAGLVVIGAGLGLGKIGGSAMDAIARQPEAAGKIQTAMIIIAALLEGLAFGALILGTNKECKKQSCSGWLQVLFILKQYFKRIF